MSEAILKVIDNSPKLRITTNTPILQLNNGMVTLKVIPGSRQLEITKKEIHFIAHGFRGLPGIDGAAGLTSVEEDTSPSLGGDLDINGFEILGQLDTGNLVIDGGLL